MIKFFEFINQISDILVKPFSGLSGLTGLIIVSLVSAIILLYVFKISSNQKKIKYHKDKIFGHFLEIAIYRDQFRRTMSCQASILKHNLLYLRYFLFPLLIIMPPVIIVCMQLDFRLGYEPLEKESSFIIQAKLDEHTISNKEDLLDKINITSSDNISIDTQALRDINEDSVFWRASITDPAGDHFIQIKVGETGEIIRRSIAVTKGKDRFTPDTRKIKSFSDHLFSGETNIPQDSVFQLVKVSYRQATYPFISWEFSPIVYYFLLTISFGFILKPFIKVRF